MKITIETPQEIEDHDEVSAILTEYLSNEMVNLERHAGFTEDVGKLVSATMSNIGAYLPTKGATILARDEGGELVGCIFLKFHDSHTAEIKRLYVRPAARGAGLGRRLTVAILDKARALGAGRILIDTGVWLEAARALYSSLGFVDVPPYAESENDPKMFDFLVFMELDLHSSEPG